MPPSLALLLWFILLVGLLWFDPAKETKVSAALWVPVAWMFFMGSRAPSQWLGVGSAGGMAQSFEEGDPLNRAFYLMLFILSIVILVSRSFRWGKFFAKNQALTAFLLFALVSVLWSDFPFPSFKKWFRDLGDYSLILVILSDRHPFEAVRTVLRRLGYLLIPLSVLLIKYFPVMAKDYDPWTGGQTFTGASTSKNMLGIICLVSGIYFFWDTVVRWPEHKNKRQKRIIVVNAVLFGMVVWLLKLCDSATSRACLIIACLVILAAHSKVIQRRPRILSTAIPVIFLIFSLLFFGFGLNEAFAGAVGRTSLSGRPQIWHMVLSFHTNPVVGTGYESFWLGSRLQRIWAGGMGQINEAHNGYLEVYLNLGYVGLFLLFLFVAASYRNICKKLKPFSSIGSLTLAIWTAFLFHNSTEADFRSGLMWITFALAALAASGDTRREVSEAAALHPVQAAEQLPPPFALSPRPYIRRNL
jgi:exopolysaccharide production protein ExoQ